MNKLSLLRRIMGWLKLSPEEVIYDLQTGRFEQPFSIVYEDGTVSNFIDPNRKPLALMVDPKVMIGVECLPGNLTQQEAEKVIARENRENFEWEMCPYRTFEICIEPKRKEVDAQLKLMGFDVLKPLESLCGRTDGPIRGYAYPQLRYIPGPKLPLTVYFQKGTGIQTSNYALPNYHPVAMSLDDGDIAVWKFPEKMTLDEAKVACEALNTPEHKYYLGEHDKWALCNYFTLRNAQEFYEQTKETLEKLKLEPLADDDLYWTDSDDLEETDNQGTLFTGLKRAVKLSTGEVIGCHPDEKHYVIAYLLYSEYMGL